MSLPVRDYLFKRDLLTADRELELYSYRIFYEIKPDNLIEVLAMIHKRYHLEPEGIPRNQ